MDQASPVAVLPFGAPAPENLPASLPPPHTSVLLVDDDPAVRVSIRRGLEAAGFRVEVAGDGNQALAKMRTETFDWVVSDIVMPNRDGLELVQAIHRQYPQTRIIAISGGGRGFAPNYLRVARFFGASHILQKPFMYGELVALIRG